MWILVFYLEMGEVQLGECKTGLFTEKRQLWWIILLFVGTSVGGGEDVVGDDTSHTWGDKCCKNDEECLEVDFCVLNMNLNFGGFWALFSRSFLPATAK